jgi:uncharacterized protein (TIGR02246 family)
VDVIDRQIDAYNARDIDGFLAAYAPDAVIEDGRGNVLMRGVDEIRAEYEPFFRDFPSLHGRVLRRMAAGAWTVDEELITGWQPEPVAALVAYHVAADRIDRVLLLS